MRLQVFTITVCLLTFSALFAQKNIHPIILDTTLNTSNLSILDSIVNDKKLVLNGENHSFTSSNELLKFKEVIYLYDKGFRYFTMELGAGVGYLCNAYVIGDDESVIEYLETADEKDSAPIYTFLKRIRAFNTGKTYTDKVKIKGVDYTRYPTYALKSLTFILDKANAASKFPIYYDDLETVSTAKVTKDNLGFSTGDELIEDFDLKFGYRSYRNQLFTISVKKLVNDFYKDSILFKKELSDTNYTDFKELIVELDETIKWYKGEGLTIQTHTARERHLAKRTKDIFLNDSCARVFGQFGRCHIRTEDYDQDCYSFNMNSFTQTLNQDSLFKNQVLILPIFYSYLEDVRAKDVSLKSITDSLVTGKLYLYNTKANYFEFDEEIDSTPYIFINTMSYSDEMDGVNGVVEDTLNLSYRDKFYEDNHMEFFSSYTQTDFTALNSDLGLDFLPNEQLFYGMGYSNHEGGVYFGFKTMLSLPQRYASDSLNLKFTNWYMNMDIGFNSIFRKHITVYHSLQYFQGFSKLKEDRGLVNSSFTYDYEKESVKYRNPYFGLGLNTGIKLKFEPICFFAEAGYRLDLSNKKFRNGGILGNSAEVDYSGLNFRAGISFYFAYAFSDYSW